MVFSTGGKVENLHRSERLDREGKSIGLPFCARSVVILMAEKEKNEKGNGESAEATVASASTVVAEREELPKTIVRRLVKEKLSQLSKDSDISVLRDALQAFSESARIFIHYLSAT